VIVAQAPAVHYGEMGRRNAAYEQAHGRAMGMVQALPRWTEYRVPDTLPDDTEESIVGTEWHQEAISALTGMLREAARRHGTAWRGMGRMQPDCTDGAAPRRRSSLRPVPGRDGARETPPIGGDEP